MDSLGEILRLWNHPNPLKTLVRFHGTSYLFAISSLPFGLGLLIPDMKPLIFVPIECHTATVETRVRIKLKRI